MRQLKQEVSELESVKGLAKSKEAKAHYFDVFLKGSNTIDQRFQDLYEECRVADRLHKQFEIVRKLGEGSYGDVYLMRDKETKEEYALKIQ